MAAHRFGTLLEASAMKPSVRPCLLLPCNERTSTSAPWDEKKDPCLSEHLPGHIRDMSRSSMPGLTELVGAFLLIVRESENGHMPGRCSRRPR